MNNKFVKGFTQFVNENLGEGQADKEVNSFGEDLFLDYEKQDAIIADALGCESNEVSNYFIGSPVDMNPDLISAFDSIKDLFNGGGESVEDYDNFDWTLKKKGRIIYHIEVSAPDGYQVAHYFHHNGMRVVVVDANDGPYIYIKKN